MFIDLDCRFDVSSFAKALERRIVRTNGESFTVINMIITFSSVGGLMLNYCNAN